jgi:tetratricopeptide (TPR) repeat protein
MKKSLITSNGCLTIIMIVLMTTVLGQSFFEPETAEVPIPVVPSPTPWPSAAAQARIAAIEHVSSGWVAYYMENYADAETEFTIAIEYDPAWTEGYMGRAMAYLMQERWAESERDFTKVIERDPNDAALYSGFRAYVRNYMGDFQGALDDCNRSISLNPNLSFNYSNRGWIHSNLGEYEQAIADYTYAMMLDPTESFYYYQRANFREILWYLNEAEMDRYLMRGFRSFGCEMCDDAITYLTLATNYEPVTGDRPPDIDYAYAWYGLGRQHFASGDYELALEAFLTASDLAPVLPQPLAWAGEAATALGDSAVAADYYERALAVNSEYPEGYLLRARALDAAGQHDAALGDYGQWVRLMEARDIVWDYFTPAEPFVIALDETFVYHIPVWGEEGQTLTVNVEKVWTPSNNASPLILILDSAGEVVAGDAVQPSFDESASVELTLPATGTYTLLITHLAEVNGPARVTIDLKPHTEGTGSSFM